ncbi:SRPBCC family protein [Nonomuraea jiangxiensis]|uniref:Uncharacterized conserved protein YndB, AHSA1/START domain n=1 Tax=Nonomuraea jiangxiensis TaxID=633440 RepID=A0A1G9N8R4_9ACTN|nr:SRPBCC domain-containing protein [Nonomuraea jiangxiensis]SDL82889.1 Uncharacterized conserved protein YndB, AHSA1/START domain [Nonomuraea jiangxiensis]
MNQTRTGALAVRMKRVISGPAEAVYAAFLDPDLLMRWYAPAGSRLAEVEVDPRVGGRHHTVVIDQDGGRHENHCEILELIPAEKIVMTWIYRGPQPLADPSEQLLTVEFRALGDRSTELTLLHERLDTVADRDGVRAGWSSLLDRLEEVIADA